MKSLAKVVRLLEALLRVSAEGDFEKRRRYWGKVGTVT